MEPKRHVSRWRTAPSSAAAANGENGVDSAATKAPTSLRYLNEFVGKLQCAPALLEHNLYPDAKEITESMGVFNAVRKYMLRDDQEAAMQTELQQRAGDAVGKADGIVVVGDGSTPRTAAMFAHRLRHWKSYSIDPAMEYRSSERSLGWEKISNLVVIRNKIEKVRITLRRAIVVLVHAHVTLEQALSAIDAEMVVGVITLPCCNWFSKQETLFGRHPDLVYDDFSILSDKREVRLWVGGERLSSEPPRGGDIVMLDTEVKVCVRKTFVGGYQSDDQEEQSGDDKKVEKRSIDTADSELLSPAELVTKASAEVKQAKVFDIVCGLLSREVSDSQDVIPSESNAGVFPVAEVAAQVGVDKHVLVLDGGDNKATGAARTLLRNGYRHVCTLGKPTSIETKVVDDAESHDDQIMAMTVPISKLSTTSIDGVAESDSARFSEDVLGYLRIAAKPWSKHHDEHEDDFEVTFEAQLGSSPLALDCIVDNRFVYRGFRGERRNVEVFRKLSALVYQLAGSTSTSNPLLLSITPRKIWRKKAYLAHEALQFEIQTIIVKQQQQLAVVGSPRKEKKRDFDEDTDLFIYCCVKGKRAAAATVDKQELDLQHQTKESVLAMKLALQTEFDARRQAIPTAIEELSVEQILTLKRAVIDFDNAKERRKYVQMVGKISYLRSYTNGMAFLSLVPPHCDLNASSDSDIAAMVSEFKRDPVQAFLKLDELQWSHAHLKDVTSMLHPGDDVRVLGFLGKSERGSPLIMANAMTFVRGEFEAYT
uniref:Uncharacterized protein n=1 Tax=Globisporangium ultimum (strain ATCC 200006 / CBS 805.95 / DAOM BR144) TaxID=431595 RepID=K3WDE4_GLOUD